MFSAFRRTRVQSRQVRHNWFSSFAEPVSYYSCYNYAEGLLIIRNGKFLLFSTKKYCYLLISKERTSLWQNSFLRPSTCYQTKTSLKENWREKLLFSPPDQLRKLAFLISQFKDRWKLLLFLPLFLLQNSWLSTSLVKYIVF